MSTLITTPLVGLEQIQREAFIVLFEGLNGTIAEIESAMHESDEAIATLTEQPYAETLIERIANENFYEGHIPSLIKAPVDRYPNCAVMAVRATPGAGSDQLDQLTAYRDQIFVEIMAKSAMSEVEVNRRVRRTAEAVNVCMMRNQTLNGIVHGFDSAPIVNISDVFTRKERTSYGPHWYWQGARLEYAVRKEAVHPSSSPGSIFRADQSQYDIDQA